MTTLRIFNALLTLVAAAGCAAHADVPATNGELSQWLFTPTDPIHAYDTSFDASKWQPVTVPHTWNAEDGQDGGTPYRRGPGWYRTALHVKNLDPARREFLRFNAASMQAAVYINGKFVGDHKGGFSAFTFDVTDFLHEGDNALAVRVNNGKDADIAPLSADFTFFGGLYRPVEFFAKNFLSFSPLDGSDGVYLKQTNVTDDGADLEVVAAVRNALNTTKNAKLSVKLTDAGGVVVASADAQIKVEANASSDAAPVKLHVDHPHLWAGRPDPYRYTLVASLHDGDAEADEFITKVGLRYFKVDPDKGFFLNGKPYNLHGVNRHQDHINKGWAITDADVDEDYKLIAEMGCTAVRLAHYQHSQYEYSVCDKLGIVVWAELPLVNSVTHSDAFDKVTKQQLRELILQSENHPSICFWSLYNELGMGNKQQASDWTIVAELKTLAHELDPTRPTVAATAQKPTNPINWVPDLTAFNDYPGWYHGTVQDWPKILDAFHAAHADRGIAVSEYGAGAAVTQHEAGVTKVAPGSTWHPEEYQAYYHEMSYPAMEARPYLWATFVWNMFDFASDGRKEGDHAGRNDKGLVTYDRQTRKDAFYYYKAAWTTEPFVHLTQTRDTPRRPGKHEVKVYTNCDTVELFEDGKSLGSQPVTNRTAKFEAVQFKQGKSTLRAVGKKSDKEFEDESTWTVDPNAPTTRPATRPTTRPTTRAMSHPTTADTNPS